jgi:DNA-binding MarR family transcriptional regulator
MNDDQKQFFMKTVEIRILAGILVRATHRAIEERLSSVNADISGLQYGILRSLSHESGTSSELSRKFVLDPSTLVPVIETLVRKGLVARNRDRQDRRRFPLSLTPAGAELIRTVPVIHEDDLLYQCLGSMGSDKTQELLELLREVVHGMPEGDDMLQSVSSRLYALQEGDENPEWCKPKQESSPKDRRRDIQRRTRIRNYIRRRRSR